MTLTITSDGPLVVSRYDSGGNVTSQQLIKPNGDSPSSISSTMKVTRFDDGSLVVTTSDADGTPQQRLVILKGGGSVVFDYASDKTIINSPDGAQTVENSAPDPTKFEEFKTLSIADFMKKYTTEKPRKPGEGTVLKADEANQMPNLVEGALEEAASSSPKYRWWWLTLPVPGDDGGWPYGIGVEITNRRSKGEFVRGERPATEAGKAAAGEQAEPEGDGDKD